MSPQTQKNLIGKTQTIVLAEVQSERWLSWVRLWIAAIYGVVALFGFFFERTTVSTLTVQLGAVGVLAAYSAYYLLYYSSRMVKGYFVYVLIFLDVFVISLILWSYSLSGAGIGFITGAVFGSYFIVIAFTALHHRVRLSLFCGLTSAAGYTILVFLYASGTSGGNWLESYSLCLVLLLTVAGLGAIISRNNSRTIQQVVSSEIKYQHLVHRLPEMLFTLDRKGNFLWSNLASSKILAISSKAIVGQPLRNFLVNPESLKLDRTGVKGAFQINDFNGNRKFVDCVIQAIEDETGPAVYEGLMTDITDRELAISQREEMVHRLFQYQKMESLGTLASGMAHDFNNILQNVNDTTAIVEHESNEEETRKRMRAINESLADAKFLVSELLALGRKKPLDYRPININHLFETMISQFSEQLGPKYSVSLDMQEDPIWVQGDPDYLKRVFQNLVGNSRDAMPEGGRISVSCTFQKNGSDAGTAVIQFSDTGSGIPAELTEKIFDPFFTTKKPGKGTGLGLALVRRIIMLHNGNVFVEKTGLQGTTFKIEIPVSDSAESDNDTKTILLHRIPATLLLLDDDPKIREVLKFFLKEFNYTIIEASDSGEASKMLSEHTPQCKVIVMDWKIGNVDPHAIIKNLREINKDLIVIVVSGYPPVQKSIERMKIQKWFTKPYNKNHLDIEIQRALATLRKPAIVPDPA